MCVDAEAEFSNALILMGYLTNKLATLRCQPFIYQSLRVRVKERKEAAIE